LAKKSGKLYIPDRGDIVWLNFDPSEGKEIRKKRPALTLSPKAYNAKVGLGIFCPITNHKKDYPFEVNIVSIPAKVVEGVVLADHAKSMDWQQRNVQFIGHVSSEVLEEVIDKLSILLIHPELCGG
jgi:mRNA interferase MazF